MIKCAFTSMSIFFIYKKKLNLKKKRKEKETTHSYVNKNTIIMNTQLQMRPPNLERVTDTESWLLFSFSFFSSINNSNGSRVTANLTTFQNDVKPSSSSFFLFFFF